MSFDAIKWAFKQKTKKSTEKLVLLSLANCANTKHADLAFPSAQRICEETQLNKKTIYIALASLVEQKIITYIDKKVGHTQSVKVYRLNIQADPKTDHLIEQEIDEIEADYQETSTPEIGPSKLTRKRIEAHPKTDRSTPNIGSAKHTQNRVILESEADPKTDRSTPENGSKLTRKRVKEPVNTSKEPVNIKNIYTDHAGKIELNFDHWPSLPSEEIFKDWKAARKLKKQSLSQTVINQFGDEISKAALHGFTADQCLSEVLMRGWQGFKFEWLEGKVTPISKKKFTGFDQTDYRAQVEAEGFATEIRL